VFAWVSFARASPRLAGQFSASVNTQGCEPGIVSVADLNQSRWMGFFTSMTYCLVEGLLHVRGFWQSRMRSVRRHTRDRWFSGRRDHSALRIEVEHDQFTTFVAPRRWQLATGYLPMHHEVCRVAFGVSPWGDQIYVRDLEVHPSLRRRGLAVALLGRVVEQCTIDGKALPITPIQETWDSVGFWDRLRDDPVPGLTVQYPMRLCEMQHEAAKWQDLAQSSAEMSRFIRHRLNDWHAASPSRFRLYRVFDFRVEPRLFELAGQIENHCLLDPHSFKASLL